jgi:hypothetical protein
MINDPIADSMNMAPLVTEPVEEAPKPLVPTQISDDFEQARGNLYSIIAQGGESLEDLIELAKQSQNPRAYEVVSTMINSLVVANEKLLDLQKKKKDLEVDKGGPKTINNTLVVTTAELQKMLKQNDQSQ